MTEPPIPKYSGYDAFLLPTGIRCESEDTVLEATLVLRPYTQGREKASSELAKGRDAAESDDDRCLLADWPAFVRDRILKGATLSVDDAPSNTPPSASKQNLAGVVTSPALDRCYRAKYKGDIGTDVQSLWGRVFSDQGGGPLPAKTFYGFARALYRQDDQSGLLKAVTQDTGGNPAPGKNPAPNILSVRKASIAHVMTMQRAKVIEDRIEQSRRNPPGEPDVRRAVSEIWTPNLDHTPADPIKCDVLSEDDRKRETQKRVKAALEAERAAIKKKIENSIKDALEQAKRIANAYHDSGNRCSGILDSRSNRFANSGVQFAAAAVNKNDVDPNDFNIYAASSAPDPEPADPGEAAAANGSPSNPIANRWATVLGIPGLQRVLHLTVDIEAHFKGKPPWLKEGFRFFRFNAADAEEAICKSRSTLAKIAGAKKTWSVWPCTYEEYLASDPAQKCGAVDQIDGLLNLETAIAGENHQQVHRFSIDTLNVQAAIEAEVQRSRASNFLQQSWAQTLAEQNVSQLTACPPADQKTDPKAVIDPMGESTEADALRGAAAERKLKTAGFQLFDQWRGDVAIKQYVAAFQAANRTYLDADDLTTGVALDIGFSTKEGQPRRWACLTNRHITYSSTQRVGTDTPVNLEALAEIFGQEGLSRKESRPSLDGVFISMPARLVGDGAVDPQSSETQASLTAYQETSVAVWDGDPLGVRCKTQTADVPFDGLPIDMTFTLPMKRDGDPLPPRLRVGAPYWLSARTILLGGVKRRFVGDGAQSVLDAYEKGLKSAQESAIPIALPGSPNEYRRFLRHEWIDAPMAATPWREVHEEFSTLRGLDGETLVVRLAPDPRPKDVKDAQRYGPDETRRVLCAPPVDFNFVHLHGVFDSGADPTEGGLRDVDYEPARGGFPSFSPQRFPLPNNIRFEPSNRLDRFGIVPDAAHGEVPSVPDGGVAIFRPRSIWQSRKSEEIYLPDPAARHIVIALKKRSRRGHYLEGCPIIRPLYPKADGKGPTTQGYPDALPVIIRLVALPHGSDEPPTKYEQIPKRAKGLKEIVGSDLSQIRAQTVTIPLLPGENFDLIAWCIPDPAHIAAWFDAADSLAFYAQAVCAMDPKELATPPSDTLNQINCGKVRDQKIRREEATVEIDSVTIAAQKIHEALCRFPLLEFAAPRRMQIIHAVEKPPTAPEILIRTILGDADREARLYETVAFRRVDDTDRRKLLTEVSVSAVALSPDGNHILTGSYGDTARLWDAATGAAVATLDGHTDAIRAVAFSPDGKRLLTGSDDETARLWDVASGSAVLTLAGHSDAVSSVAYSPDGTRVLTGSDDNTARLWDAATGAAVATLDGHSEAVLAIAFSPDGKIVLTSSDDKTARLWDVAKATSVKLEHSDTVRAVAFSPDGKIVLTGSDDRTARLWDSATGDTVRTLNGHMGAVRAVAFSPDDRFLLTGSGKAVGRGDRGLCCDACGTFRRCKCGCLPARRQGRSYRLRRQDGKTWDAATGSAVATLDGHLDAVREAIFSRDGKRVLTGSDDKTARVWDAATGTAVATLDGRLGWREALRGKLDSGAAAVIVDADVAVDQDVVDAIELRVTAVAPTGRPLDNPNLGRIPEDRIRGDWPEPPEDCKPQTKGEEQSDKLSASRRLYGFDVFADGAVRFPEETAIMQRWTIDRRDDLSLGPQTFSLLELSQKSKPADGGAKMGSTEESLFSDGCARRVRSQIFATSRTARQIPGREVYPDAQAQEIDRKRRYVWSGADPKSPPPESIVRAVVRPAALPVHSLLPAFVWTPPASQPKNGAALSRSTCIRIPFSRPAMTSGVEERVGIVLWPPNILGAWIEVNKGKGLWNVADLAKGAVRPVEPLSSGGGTSIDMHKKPDGASWRGDFFTDDDLGPGGAYITRWGADPIHPEGEVGWLLGMNSFTDQPYWADTAIDSIDAEDKNTGLLWPESDVYEPRLVENVLMPLPKSENDGSSKSKDAAAAAGAAPAATPVSPITEGKAAEDHQFMMVSLLTYAPRFDVNTERWYVDVDIDPGASPDPFLRVGLVRFQPHAARNLQVSLPTAEWVQIVGKRRDVRVEVSPPAGEQRRYTAVVTVESPLIDQYDEDGSKPRHVVSMKPAGSDPDPDGSPATMIRATLIEHVTTSEGLTFERDGRKDAMRIQTPPTEVRFGQIENGVLASVTLSLELPGAYDQPNADKRYGSVEYAVFVEEVLCMKSANQSDGAATEKESYIEGGTRFAVKVPIPSYSTLM